MAIAKLTFDSIEMEKTVNSGTDLLTDIEERTAIIDNAELIKGWVDAVKSDAVSKSYGRWELLKGTELLKVAVNRRWSLER